MLVEDHRNISCGGDPFNYLKSVMKGLFYQLSPGQDAEILVNKDTFPYDSDVFKGLAQTSKLTFVDLKEQNGEFTITVRRPM